MGNSTRAKVREMTAKGLTKREIATLLGLSTQAIYLQLKAIKAEDKDRGAA